jgi:hypothetical protein
LRVVAHEQLHGKSLFQRGNCGGNRRLRDMHAFGVEGDTARFTRSDEIAQLFQCKAAHKSPGTP